ncbi:MAG: hypothetical protein HW376_1108 [candidate division NC10 bacterium]|nr:hypothetical protein [candidate division NC10 bacterium]
MIERLIDWSARNRFLVFLSVIFLSLWGASSSPTGLAEALT